MALTGTALAIGGTLISGASAGYQSKRGHDQKVQAQHQASDATAAQNAAVSAQQAQEKANKERAAQSIMMRRQQALRQGMGGRAGTIRTAPLGVQNSPRVGGNSYLGAA